MMSQVHRLQFYCRLMFNVFLYMYSYTCTLFYFEKLSLYLTLSLRRPLSYRNRSNDLQSKPEGWFLYDNGLRHERFKGDENHHH